MFLKKKISLAKSRKHFKILKNHLQWFLEKHLISDSPKKHFYKEHFHKLKALQIETLSNVLLTLCHQPYYLQCWILDVDVNIKNDILWNQPTIQSMPNIVGKKQESCCSFWVSW